MTTAGFDYTLVIGVDERHLHQLSLVWPTWIKHKPSLLQHPMVVFYDRDCVKEDAVTKVVRHPNLRLCSWPPDGITYQGDPNSKWYHPQRYKMLAGFVHVPALTVETPYWLKLDTDVVATGKDNWIHDEWFKDLPAIVAHRWGFTKPPEQIQLLDAWVAQYKHKLLLLAGKPAVDLKPEPGASKVNHPRIISWCGFFSTWLTRLASGFASTTVGEYQLPVPSQDGYLWYVAKRLDYPIVRTIMKDKGWEWWCTDKNVKKAAERALYG